MCWLKSKHLINALGDNVSNSIMIKGAKRLRNRFPDRPALVKVNFGHVQEKILVLRKKYPLKDSDIFKQGYLKSSKSRAERLIVMNARVLLRQLPNRDSLS